MIIRKEIINLIRLSFEKAIMLILVLFFAIFLMCGVAQAAETKEEIKKRDAMANKAINDLKIAIETRDFSKLRYDVPDEKPLSWSSPDLKSESRLSFGEMINKLAEISKNKNIIINEIPLQTFGTTTIETRGWRGVHPYLYFQFKEVGDGWRWLNVCDSQSCDFRHAEKCDFGDPRKNIKLQGLISHFKQTMQSKNFMKLKIYVPDKTFYGWSYGCDAGDMPAEDLSFEEITKILLRESKGAKIYFNPKPEVEWTYFKSMLIETEGWLGEYPFVTFSFGLIKDRLIWDGACYSPTPTLRITKDNKFEQTYFRKPQLPRPGPRTFKDDFALMARIDEIVKFKAFDALEAYAVNKTLIFERHNNAAIDDYSGKYGILKGKKKPVREVIAFLKKNAQNAKEIKVSAIHRSYRQTSGWGGKYPFITFWIAEGKSGWEFIGITYHKVSIIELLFSKLFN
jgi:hypothetical protein